MQSILTKTIGAGVIAAALLSAIGSDAPAFAQAREAARENVGPNKNILRWAKGAYAYNQANESRRRGFEE